MVGTEEAPTHGSQRHSLTPAASCVEPLSGYWDPATVSPSCCPLFFHETISTDDAPAMHKLLNIFRKNQQGEGQGPRELVILKEGDEIFL